MRRLLHLDASPRSERSHSRRMTKLFVEQWIAASPADEVIYRDVGHEPPPHVDEAWVAAAFTPPERRTPTHHKALEWSDRLVDEFLAADVIVLGVPMYNFGVPSTLKAYIDQIVREGRTFRFEPDDRLEPYKPLVSGKTMYVFTARGASGYGHGGPYESLNHLDPHLEAVFDFIGVRNLIFTHVENDEFGGDGLAKSLEAARLRIPVLVAEANSP